MPKIQTALGLILLAFLATGAGWFLYWLFTAVNPTVAAATVAASATVVVSTITVVFGKRRENSDHIARELRNQKAPIYEEFISGYLTKTGLLGAADRLPVPKGRSGKSRLEPDEELVRFFKSQTPKLMVWASDEVVAKWSDLRNTNTAGIDQDEMLRRVAALFRAVRVDLGHSGNATDRELLGLFVNLPETEDGDS